MSYQTVKSYATRDWETALILDAHRRQGIRKVEPVEIKENFQIASLGLKPIPVWPVIISVATSFAAILLVVLQ